VERLKQYGATAAPASKMLEPDILQ